MFIYAEVQGFILYDRIRKGEHKLLKYVCETPSSPCTLSCRYLAVHKKRVNYDLCPEIPEVLNMKYELTKDTSYLLKLVRKYPYTPYALKGLNLKTLGNGLSTKSPLLSCIIISNAGPAASTSAC